MPQTKRAILTEGATFFKRDAFSNAHVISGRTRDSIKIESITDNEATITAGFGMPFEEKRSGTKEGTPHATMTEAANNTNKQMPSIIKKHMDDLFNRQKGKATG
jgi:hypothetical protein